MPLTVPEIVTLASAASTLLSTAVTVTVPLSLAFAAMVSVVPVNETVPAGAALTVTVTSEDTALGTVAFSVVELPPPLSAIVNTPSSSATFGFDAPDLSVTVTTVSSSQSVPGS